MSDIRVRKALSQQAARLMYERHEKEYYTAKRKAARMLGERRRVRHHDLPSNREIHQDILRLARLHEGDAREERLETMRLSALSLMRQLEAFRPRLIGSVLTGHARRGSDIDLHLFSDEEEDMAHQLDALGLEYEIEHKLVVKRGEEREFTHFHLESDGFEFELTLYPVEKVHYVFKSSITGKAMEWAGVRELESILLRQDPGLPIDELTAWEYPEENDVNPFDVFWELLSALAHAQQDPRFHPEGDALYHSLQVFELAREARPDDGEFLLAALLHDVGKAIDPDDHVEAGLEALEGFLPERSEFLILHHMDMLRWQQGRLARGLKRELKASPFYQDLELIRRCDNQGREDGRETCSLEEALDYLEKTLGWVD